MSWADLTPDELERHRPDIPEPADFDASWAETIAAARAHDIGLERAPFAARLATVDVEDATFRGFDGQPIRAWIIVPRNAGTGRLPSVVQYVGYGGGRSFPYDWLFWPSAGYLTLVMDTRGQGSAWSPGETPDRGDDGGPHYPGFVTRGIGDPSTHYYRRLYTDAVRAVDAIRAHPGADPERTIIAGASQGGGMALAAAAFAPDLRAALIDVPFLCDIERAITITDELPYVELARYLGVHRDKVAETLATVRYVEGVHLARRARVPALFSVGLTDLITPPSTVYAAYNHYAGPKEMRVWPYSGHDAGAQQHLVEQLTWLDGLGLLPG